MLALEVDKLLLELVEFVEVANDGETNVDSLFATRFHCARVRRGPTAKRSSGSAGATVTADDDYYHTIYLL